MKKFLLVSFVFVFMLMGFNINSASASNCAPGDLFNSVTGQPCSTDSTTSRLLTIGSKGDDVRAVQQILKDEGYSLGKIDGKYGKRTYKAIKEFQDDNDLTITGNVNAETLAVLKTFGSIPIPIPQPISENSPVISGISGPQKLEVNQTGTWTVKASNSTGGNLKYAVVWGDEVSALQKESRANIYIQSATFSHSYSDEGIYKPTFYVISENTIRCITTPCGTNAGSAMTSLSVNVGGGVTPISSITVLSPNGGEGWTRGTTQTIKWKDNTTYPACPVGVNCTLSAPAPKFYDIKMSSYTPPCTYGQVCSGMPMITYTIAKDVSGNSYDWSIGKITESYYSISGGKYIIQVCQSGSTTVCDSSNNYFEILSPNYTY